MPPSVEPKIEKTDHQGDPIFGLARLRAEVRHHALLLLITAAYSLIILYFLSSHGMLNSSLFQEYLIAMAVPIVAIAAFRFFGETVHHAINVRPFQWTGLWQGFRQCEIFSGDRAAAAAVPILLLPLFAGIFTSFKVTIPEMAPFSWDPALMRLDLAMHGGFHPWALLQPILGHPLVTSAISYLYNLWFAMWLVVYWQMFRVNNRVLRMQFLLSFVLAWIVLGSIGAFYLSSAGPVYYGAVVDGPNPYAGLMAYLNDSHGVYRNWSIIAQDYLWQIYQSGNAHLGGGISAMPSLHVGVALLVYLLARHFGRLFAWLAGVYLLIIIVGSIHLGWHYAVDSYVSIIGTLLIWGFSGWVAKHMVPSAPEPYESANQ